MKALSAILILTLSAYAVECDPDATPSVVPQIVALQSGLIANARTIFPTLQEATAAQMSVRRPDKFITTPVPGLERFPSFSRCERSFFRVATIGTNVDDIITRDGWKSGWVRRSEETSSEGPFDALPPSAPVEDRIIEYVRVQGVPSQFPKHSSIVGVLEDPIRTISVGYHTGMNAGFGGNHMRLDEIEVGPCARAPECQNLRAHDSSAVFAARNLTPRYSTAGEWAIENQVPASCVVATYRITFQKVGTDCYSDSNNSCPTPAN